MNEHTKITKPETAKNSTEHFEMLRHRDEEPQFSGGMEMPTRIAADLRRHLERVSRAATGYQKTVRTETKTDDPIT
jgi:hypothetical protein